jgi:PD-(D/E)XK endonuclease
MKGLIPVSHPSLSFFSAPAAQRLHHRKLKGEWAEMVFLARATALGFTVCKPYGDYHPFDFLVRASGNTCSVQVKSGWIGLGEWLFARDSPMS